MTTPEMSRLRRGDAHDPVASLRDVESEARELGIELDPMDGPEPLLD